MEEEKVSYRAGAIVINHDGEIALANEHLWGFPRGGVEENEDFLTAAKREVLEEVGVEEIEYEKVLGVYRRYPNGITQDTPGAYPMEIHMFLFLTSKIELLPRDTNVKETGWFSFAEALNILTNEEDKNFLLNHKDDLFNELEKETSQLN